MGERGGAGGELAYGTEEKKCPMLRINFCAMKDRGASEGDEKKTKEKKTEGIRKPGNKYRAGMGQGEG